MPKQVRLRRGTTAQHATFTGADGEVTFDTTKKALVVHDGVTAGGKPIDGFVKLDPGAPLSNQEIKTTLSVSGGDSDTDSFTVTYPSRFGGQVIVDDTLIGRRIQMQQEGIIYAASVALNFGSFGFKVIDLAGNITFSGINMINGRNLMVRLKADASLRTLTFPAGWRWIGSAAPANIAANKVAMLWLWCFGPGDGDVMARYLVEP
jgi:hypothetical protein